MNLVLVTSVLRPIIVYLITTLVISVNNLYTYVSSDIYTIDIEHTFYMFNIIDKNNVYSSDEKMILGISGMVTRTGEVVSI